MLGDHPSTALRSFATPCISTIMSCATLVGVPEEVTPSLAEPS